MRVHIKLSGPGFVEMMQQLEQGKAAAVFVKDLSRLGRNYIEHRHWRVSISFYMERLLYIRDRKLV